MTDIEENNINISNSDKTYKTTESHRLRQKKYYEKNKETQREAVNNWRTNNADKYKELKKIYNFRFRERQKQKKKELFNIETKELPKRVKLDETLFKTQEELTQLREEKKKQKEEQLEKNFIKKLERIKNLLTVNPELKNTMFKNFDVEYLNLLNN